MKVESIKEKLNHYKVFLKREGRLSAIWDIEQNFRTSWNLHAEDLLVMFDQSLQSSVSRNYWKREKYEPKKNMLAFIQLEPEYVRQAFTDLFNEDVEPEQRMDRFSFYSDQLLAIFKNRNKYSVVNNHDQDYAIISLYLSLKYPGHYSPYRFEWFEGICRVFDAKPQPKVDDPARYFKMVRIIAKFMYKDEELRQLYESELRVRKLFFRKPFETLYPAGEFCAYCSGNTMP
ncbi:MAG: hypothetical protein EA409_06870 [Saprospirales bacterium]|nr:MAG: hypothetical protein EA409_06870 [Saprospirales bacterium]